MVCRVNVGVQMPGKAEFAVIHDKRAYLFPSAKERDVFKADTKKCERADVAQGGYCSVCVVTAKKRVAGKPEIVSVYDGMRYYFPGADEKKSFDADPAKFTPALEGDCVVCLKDAGKRVAGQPKFSAMHDWRIYLFPDEGAQKKFIADPKKYSTVDVAMGGNCAVCAKMMKKEMPGKAEFTSVYKDQRYFFPSPAAAASRSWVTSAMWVELIAGRRRHLTKTADGRDARTKLIGPTKQSPGRAALRTAVRIMIFPMKSGRGFREYRGDASVRTRRG